MRLIILILFYFFGIINKSVGQTNEEILVERANAFFDKQDYENSVKTYTEIIKKYPKKYDAFYGRGISLFQQKKYELAKKDFDSAININPNISHAFNGRASTLQLLGFIESAIADYSKSISINPNDAYPFFQRGNIFYNQKNFQLALNDYTAALKIKPSKLTLLKVIGDSYLSLQKYDSAYNFYHQGYLISPNNEFAVGLKNSCKLYYTKYLWEHIYIRNAENENLATGGNTPIVPMKNIAITKTALQIADELIKIFNDFSFAYYFRSHIFNDLDNKTAAIQDLKKALSLEPNNEDYLEYLKDLNK